jgi:hypothetical protein
MIRIHLPSKVQSQTIAFYSTYFGFKRVMALGPVVLLENGSSVSLAMEEVSVEQAFPPTFAIEFVMPARQAAVALLEHLSTDGCWSDDAGPSVVSDAAVLFSVRDPDDRRVAVAWSAT